MDASNSAIALRNSRRYWRGVIFLPVVGAVIGAVSLGAGVVWERWASLLYVSFYAVAIPYVPFTILAWWAVGKCRSIAQHVVLSLMWPILFAPFGIIYGVTLARLDFHQPWEDVPRVVGLSAPVILVFGYGWVALAIVTFAAIVAARNLGHALTMP
jgi:hypothetical protein